MGEQPRTDREAERGSTKGDGEMSRRMSVWLTRQQVRDGSKTETRRHPDTWTTTKAGDVVTLIEKGQGLPKGAKQVAIREVEILDNRVEPLSLVDEAAVAAEGFPGHDPIEWQIWWAKSHGFRPPRPLDAMGQSEVLAWLATIECRCLPWRYLGAIS